MLLPLVYNPDFVLFALLLIHSGSKVSCKVCFLLKGKRRQEKGKRFSCSRMEVHQGVKNPAWEGEIET